MQHGNDWHFDIQHIQVQTVFTREQLKKKNFIVIYLKNKLIPGAGLTLILLNENNFFKI